MCTLLNQLLMHFLKVKSHSLPYLGQIFLLILCWAALFALEVNDIQTALCYPRTAVWYLRLCSCCGYAN